MSFEKLKLDPRILKALKEQGYEKPTPIQAESIPTILEKRDILGCAQTGTGKTAAFSIPTLQLISKISEIEETKTIKSLIVTPTRELAIQIGDSIEKYAKYLGIKHTVIFGGVNKNPQIKRLKKGVDIVVATPGRLLDLRKQGHIPLNNVQIFTLDEADRMLDMGFINDIKKIISKLPEKRQSLFFSATMPKSIVELANRILTNPKKVEVARVSSTAETVKQHVYHVNKRNKNSLLIHVLKNKNIDSALVFTRTKHGADKVTRFINKSGFSAEAIHGNKRQNARQRALANFKSGKTRILVATDIASRGIDIDELMHVINFEIPNISETYVHRIGRTGRAGSEGISYSFCDIEEQQYLKDIEKLIKKSIPTINDHPYPLSKEQGVNSNKRTHKKLNSPKGKTNNNWKNRKRKNFNPKKKNFKKKSHSHKQHN